MALPILRGGETMPVIKQLAALNPELSGLIEALGAEILQMPGVGLRNGLAGASDTYDIAFVRSSPSLAFATFKAPSFSGTWRLGEQFADRLTVEVRFNGALIADSHSWLDQAWERNGWHVGHIKMLAQRAKVLETIRAAHGSWTPTPRRPRPAESSWSASC